MRSVNRCLMSLSIGNTVWPTWVMGVSAFPRVCCHHHEKTDDVLIKNLKWKHSLGKVEDIQQLFTSKIVQVCGYGEVEGGTKGKGRQGRG